MGHRSEVWALLRLLSQNGVDLSDASLGICGVMSVGLERQVFLVKAAGLVQTLKALQALRHSKVDHGIFRSKAYSLLKTLQSSLKVIAGQIGFPDFDVLPDLGRILVSGGRFDRASVQLRINAL